MRVVVCWVVIAAASAPDARGQMQTGGVPVVGGAAVSGSVGSAGATVTLGLPATALAQSEARPILGLRAGTGHLLAEPITITKKDGSVHPLSYDPSAPVAGSLRGAWSAVASMPEKIRNFRRFVGRVDELVNDAITDDNLWWSVNRLNTVTTQEGILRPSNNLLVNKWSMGSSLKEARPEDFRDSSLSMESRIKLFKVAMDLEEPTLQYQYAFAQNLHNLTAELSAAAAYLTMKANTVKDSPTDQALDGIYRDEVYHYVIMSLVNKFALGQASRWTRLARIFRHSFDYRPPAPNDEVVHRRKLGSPLMALEVGYAFLAIDKRIDRFLKAMHPETAKELIGPTRLSQKALDADIAEGKLIPTKFFRMEQNSDLTKDEVETLAKRFPAWFDAGERKVKASDIREVLDTYRRRSLTNPRYWLKRKGFKVRKGPEFAGRTVIERELSPDEGTALRLEFQSPGAQPTATVVDYAGGGTTLWTAPVESLSLLQVGALMDAEKWEGFAQALEAKKQDLSYEELMRKMSNNRTYQADPIPVVHD